MSRKPWIQRVLPKSIIHLKPPLQRPISLAYLISLVSAIVVACLILGSLPFADLENARMNTGLLFAVLGIELWLATTALVCMWHGQFLIGRWSLLVFAIMAFLTVAIGLGPGVGGDIVGSTAVLAVPALIFSRVEKRPLIVASALALISVVAAQVIEMQTTPIIPLTEMEMQLNRGAAVFVACLVGAFVVYLHVTAEEAKEALATEKERSDNLLLNILPPQIAERLKAGETVIADDHDLATILFADIVGFTRLSSERSARNIVELLNLIFVGFDKIAMRHGLEKIKTIGDGYMAACGVPERTDDHCASTARAALAMIDLIRKISRDSGTEIGVRIGIHSGPVVAGVIGTHKFSYDLWGDAVNTASRMESASQNMRITVSQQTYELLKSEFDFEARGEIDMKGKGKLPCYFLLGERPGQNA